MVWTTPRDWTTGEFVTEAMMDTHIRDNLNVTMHILARKSADQAVNNSTVLVNDTHLSVAVAANEVWLVNAYLLVDGSGAADIKYAWTVPAGGTFQWAGYSDSAAAVASWGWMSGTPAVLLTTGTLNAVASGVGTVIGNAFSGIMANGGTAGNLQLQWAQQTANVSDTKLRQNSCLVGCRLA